MTALTVLSVVQERALDQLATYSFLTVPQMQRLGVAGDAKHLRASLNLLINRGWVGRTEEVPTTPGLGRLPHLYWLRPPGAGKLGEILDTAPPPAVRNATVVVDELPHRVATVDAHIALRAWAAGCGAQVDWFRGYYGPGGTKQRGPTTMPYQRAGKEERYKPDGIAQVTLPDGLARLLVVEVYRGGRRHTLDHFWKKLPQLRQVCEAGVVERHHEAPRAARFLILFDNQAMRDAALSRWPEASAAAYRRFFVKHMDEVSTGFGAAWRQPAGAPAELFPAAAFAQAS